MDVELQILKHLPRDAQPTVSFIDKYCVGYKDLFPEVRSYECFKYLHLGIISGIKRKSLPEIAKVVGLKSAQALHHFIAESPWSVTQLRERRLSQTLAVLKGNAITVVIDETGDRKKGKKTDYVARQYLGSLGKIDSGIVSVNAYGIYENITYKQELGWTDYRFTNFPDIEKWWEIIFCVYLMISLNSPAFLSLNQSCPTEAEIQPPTLNFSSHQQWNPQTGWKNVLNNLRLIIQPTLALWLLSPWLDLFPNHNLLLGFHELIQLMNQFQPFFPDG
jgi:hypothetical protein